MTWTIPPTQEQIEEMNKRLHKMAASFAKEENDRLDYVQTAFLALMKPNSMKNPMARAYCAMIDYYRTLNRSKKYGIPYINNLSAYPIELEEFGYIEEGLLEDEEFRSLNWLKADLTKQEKKIIVLYYIEGRTQDEVAKELNLSQVTISNRILKIREKVKDRFKGV